MNRRLTLLVLIVLSTSAGYTLWCAAVVHSQDANGNGIADRIELPGTQPNTVLPAAGTDFDIDVPLATADSCQVCHTTATNASPFRPWNGSMMGNAARDPVFYAQLDVVEADEAADPNLAGARDICLRCHMPRGWLQGRSSAAPGPALTNALRGMAMQETDLFGVQCELCHRMVDRDIATADGIDIQILNGLNTNPVADMGIPPSYGNGMYVIDRFDVRRGPFDSTQIGAAVGTFLVNPADWPPSAAETHALKHSTFQRSGNLCGTCHDVSNPVWFSAQPKGNVQANFPIERTWTEWTHSAFATQGEAGNCQSCHMNGALNGVIAGGASTAVANPNQHLNDVHTHDFTGGNVWVPRIIAQMVSRFQSTKSNPDPGPMPTIGATQAERDAFLEANYALVLKGLFPGGTFWRTTALQPEPLGFNAANYSNTSTRAVATLQRAAQLSASRMPGADLQVRVWNMVGHKLPTGYPEGRRMWLDVRFLDVNPAGGAETLTAQSGEYNQTTAELFHDFNLDNTAGPRSYDVVRYTNGSGTALGIGRRTQVYEARLHHNPSGTEFHFIKNNEVVSDNRIPPMGWVKAQYQANNAGQVIPATYVGSQMEYNTGDNFDEQAYTVPTGSDTAEIRLQYQSVSKEYIEELVAANPRNLLYPAGGVANAISRGDVLEHAWRTFDFDINGDGIMDQKQKIPPVEMVRLRFALVDTDGDQLPDDWETANGLNPNDATGDNGRNGDLDADGRSNYLEFQQSTPANSADLLRGPVDLVLVLDFSGSMSDPAPTSGLAKVDVLKDAVDLFLKTWKQYAIRTDRIGIVYFASNASIEGGSLVDLSTLPPGTTIESKLDELIAAVRSRSAGGATAMGGGLQTALNLLQSAAPGRRKQVILFTNGMQNFSPMIRADMGGNHRIMAEPVSFADGVFGDSGISDAGGPAFGTLLNTLGVQVHTIGIGVAETADDRWLNLISNIALNTSATKQFIARAVDMEGAFLYNLIISLRGFSPQLLTEQNHRLEPTEDSQTIEVTMDQAATKATFVLSWAGAQIPGRMDFDLLAPNGQSVPFSLRTTDGPNYRIATCYFPLLQTDGRPLAHAGQWKMVIRRGASGQVPLSAVRLDQPAKATWRDAVDYRAYVIADLPDIDFDVHFGKTTYRAGENVSLHLTLTDNAEQIRTLGRITAQIEKPSASFGNLISRQSVDKARFDQFLKRTDDRPADQAEAKFRVALADPDFASKVRPARQTIDLFDDGDSAHGDSFAGDGVYSANLGTATFPGLIAANISLAGQSPRSLNFSREYRVSTVVRHGPFDRGGSSISASRLGSRDRNWVVQIKVKPVDSNGNALGPGFRDRLTMEVPGFATDSPIEDQLDGTYTRNFLIPLGSLGTNVRIAFEQETIYNSSVRLAFLRGWLFFLVLLLILILGLLVVIWMIRKRRRPLIV